MITKINGITCFYNFKARSIIAMMERYGIDTELYARILQEERDERINDIL